MKDLYKIKGFFQKNSTKESCFFWCKIWNCLIFISEICKTYINIRGTAGGEFFINSTNMLKLGAFTSLTVQLLYKI